MTDYISESELASIERTESASPAQVIALVREVRRLQAAVAPGVPADPKVIEEMLAAYLGVVKVDRASTGDLTAAMERAYAVAERHVLERAAQVAEEQRHATVRADMTVGDAFDHVAGILRALIQPPATWTPAEPPPDLRAALFNYGRHHDTCPGGPGCPCGWSKLITSVELPPGYATGAEFLTLAEASIHPRSDEEVREMLENIAPTEPKGVTPACEVCKGTGRRMLGEGATASFDHCYPCGGTGRKPSDAHKEGR